MGFNGEETRSGIEPFKGDFEQLAAMLQQAWACNQEQPLLYTSEYLRSCFDYPGTSYDLAPSIYSDAGIDAFAAGFPRTVRTPGGELKLILSSFLTASLSCRGSGYGLLLWGDLAERCRMAGFDGMISYCVEGDDMGTMLGAAAALFEIPTERVASIPYLVRLLRPAVKANEPQICEADIDLFLDLSARLHDSSPFVRVWTRKEAEWQCRGRFGALTISAGHEGRRGMLTGYTIQVAAAVPVTIALLDDLLWGDLLPEERMTLLRSFMQFAAGRGATTVSCPDLNYASVEPLTQAGFRKSKRLLHMYLSIWKKPELKSLESFYIDVF